MKRAYELMVLFRSDVDEKRHEDALKKLLGDGATIKDVKPLGKKQLSYPMNKQTEAFYILAHIEADTLSVGEVEKRAKLNDAILRFLLLGRDTHGKQKS